MLGITFGTKHSHTDWGLILKKSDIPAPNPKRYTVDVPGRDGALDITNALTPHVKYENRLISFSFFVQAGQWTDKLSQIMSAVHGQTMDVKSDLDPNYMWHGCVLYNGFDSDESTGELVLTVDAEPYKLKRTETTKTKTGSGTLICANDRMPTSPTITVTADTTIEFGDLEITLSAGTHLVDFTFLEGDNELTITGSGTTTVVYQEGRL